MSEPTTLAVLDTLAPIAVTTASALSDPVGARNIGQDTRHETVRIQCTVNCCIRFASSHDAGDPEATTDDMELIAGFHEFWDVLAGTKVSFIRAASATGDGIAKITRCTKN